MSKIPTAEEFLNNIGQGNFSEQDLIEFTKLHVEAALKEASEKAELEGDEGSVFDYISVDKYSILNAYPLTNIK